MRDYGFSLARILPYKDKIFDLFLYGRIRSVKTRILAYFMQCLTLKVKFSSFITVTNKNKNNILK